jgi:hypothetical protein
MLRKISLAGLMLLAASAASAQAPRPPVGGIGSPPDAMIFFVARGAPDACGPGCSAWIAAEGTVQWDTDKRLFNILERNPGRRLPVVIRVWGASNLSVDTTVGTTEVEACKSKSEAECFALKRTGGSFEAKLKSPDAPCDLTCVLMLAGGVHCSLPAGTRVVLSGMVLRNRMAPSVSQEARDTLPARYGEQFRKYLRDMGVATELLDIVDDQGESRRAVEMPPSEWTRLHIVN